MFEAELKELVEEIMGRAKLDRRLGRCPICRKQVKYNSFRTALDVREFRISGMCQSCMDQVYNAEEE